MFFQVLLEDVKEEFQKSVGYTLDEGLKKEFRGDVRDLLRAVVRGNGYGKKRKNLKWID